MKTCLLICLTGCLLAARPLCADTLRTCTDCDTIVTTYGKVIAAEIIEKSYSTVRFYECGDTSRALNVMPMSFVRRIKHPRQPSKWDLPKNEWPAEWKQEEHRLDVLQDVGIGTVGLAWLSFCGLFVNPIFVLVGLLLAAIGVLVGLAMLLKIRSAPFLHRRRFAAHAILWVSLLPLLFVGLVLMLLYLGGIRFA